MIDVKCMCLFLFVLVLVLIVVCFLILNLGDVLDFILGIGGNDDVLEDIVLQDGWIFIFDFEIGLQVVLGEVFLLV